MSLSIRLLAFKFLLLSTIGLCLAPPTHGQVVINEIMAENANSFLVANDFPDWIELYNTTDQPVDIGGWYIREYQDVGSNIRTNIFRFPAIVPLEPFGRLIVNCDDRTNNLGYYHTMFGLPKEGTFIELMRANFSVVAGSGVSFGIQIRDLSIGRVPDGSTNWTLNLPTPGSNNVIYPTIDSPVNYVKLNEWAATNNTITGSTSNDWLEIFNLSTNPVLLSRYVIVDSLAPSNALSTFHAFTNLCFIGPEEFLRFTCDDERKPGDHLNFGLSSTGPNNACRCETVRILAPDKTTVIDQITFDGNEAPGPDPWRANISYGRLPDGGPIYSEAFIKPTPGDSNFQLMTNILVTEVLTHTDPPLEDAIEVHNVTEEWVDISNWWISNKKNTPKRFRIPSTTPPIPPGGYYVFYEYLGDTTIPKQGFNPSGETDLEGLDFTLNSAHGDEVWIFSASNDFAGTLTGLRGSLRFDALDNGVSAGPIANSVGEVEIVPLTRRTFGGPDNPTTVQQFRTGTGAPNEPTARPRFGPIVISEIYYHPPDIIRQGTNFDNDLHEFVEVYNSATTNVLMYDPTVYPHADGRTNTFRLRGVVDENFPTNFVMMPGQIVLFVNFAMTNTIALNDFRNRFNVPAHIPMFGPYGSKLDNGSGAVEIRRPDPPQSRPTNEIGFVPYIVVDRVEYDDDPPWPTLADGATNIFDNQSFIHIGYSLQRIVVEDYGDDPINWIATTPTPGRQPVRIETATRTGNSVTIRFRAWAGSGYTVQYATSVDSPVWTKLADVSPQATSGIRQVVDSNAGGATRFYRIATPVQP